MNEGPAGRRIGARVREHARTNVIGYLALFVALGGTAAWAADKVTSKDIAKSAIRPKHIKKSAVKTPKIADRAVTVRKLADGLGSLQGPQGPKGDPGPSTVYSARFDYGGGTVLPGTLTPLHTLDLPAGSYLVTASVVASNSSGSTDGVICDILPEGGDNERFFEEMPAGQSGSLSASQAVVLPAGASVTLQCIRNTLAGGPVLRRASSLHAIKVGEVVIP